MRPICGKYLVLRRQKGQHAKYRAPRAEVERHKIIDKQKENKQKVIDTFLVGYQRAYI